jgi:RNA polymerase sigma factor (TIGR02999 family)
VLPTAQAAADPTPANEGSMTAPPSPQELSRLLADSSYWKGAALDQVAPLVYEELRRLAHHYMSQQRPNHTLQTTALVHEAYLRFADQTNPHWQNRTHFFAGAAQMMRHILINYAKNRQADKRGGGAIKPELNEAAQVSQEQAEQIVALNEALEELAQVASRKAQVVELKYFGGLNYDEIAEVLKISPVTVKRDWKFAKAWLHKELTA